MVSERTTILAGALALGMAVASSLDGAVTWPWTVGGLLVLAVAIGVTVYSGRFPAAAAVVLIAAATFSFGALVPRLVAQALMRARWAARETPSVA